ncbi:hypothetical protein ILUMI_12955 [Ignelater luminosus]|uniref:Uncharacterized protein n=1 Tax=Ignelater luminosus TaxID=2038154 RepID=A0A8K0GCG0_IGNLU|nr:hypothetical protein ILUMI_12955 [Ignelater luminosus]
MEVASTELLSSWKALCDLMLPGKVADAVSNIICALQKKDDGVSPIAVGCIFRRIAKAKARFMEEKFSLAMIKSTISDEHESPDDNT